MAQVTDRTMVVHPETGAFVHLDKGDDVPSWASDLVGDHLLAGSEGDSGIPPKGGPGSGVEAWARYASAKGVKVDDDAKREDIIAALDAADVPTE